jgi:hypothetical protein
MRNLLVTSVLVCSTLSFAAAAQASKAPVNNVQINCTLDDNSAEIIIGNNTRIDDLASEALIYTKQNGKFVLTQDSRVTMRFVRESPQVGKIKVVAPSLTMEVGVFNHPLMWNAGTVNGHSAKCTIDSAFYQSLKFSSIN